jgi:hypothetical protein
MKIVQPKNKILRASIYIGVALVVIAGGLATYVYAFNGNVFGWTASKDDSSSINLDEPTDEQKQAGDDIKKQNLENEGKDSTGNTDTTETPETQPGPDKSKVSITITSSSADTTTYRLRALISALESSGTCTLTLTKDQQTVTKTADIQPSATTSTCKGFDIPVSELSAGQWNATLTYESDTLLGSASTSVTIK